MVHISFWYNVREICHPLHVVPPSIRVFQCNTSLESSSPSLDLAYSSDYGDEISLHFLLSQSKHSLKLAVHHNGYYAMWQLIPQPFAEASSRYPLFLELFPLFM